jgi:hypothetical protein
MRQGRQRISHSVRSTLGRAATAARGESNSATSAAGALRAASSMTASRAFVMRSTNAKPGSDPILTRPKVALFSAQRRPLIAVTLERGNGAARVLDGVGFEQLE